MDRPSEIEAEEALQVPYDANDQVSVNEARKKLGRKKKEEQKITVALMSHPDGRTLVFNSIKCILERLPMSFDNINMTYFNLGQEYRAMALFKDVIRLCPKEFVLMLEEHASEW